MDLCKQKMGTQRPDLLLPYLLPNGSGNTLLTPEPMLSAALLHGSSNGTQRDRERESAGYGAEMETGEAERRDTFEGGGGSRRRGGRERKPPAAVGHSATVKSKEIVEMEGEGQN